jgi:hypothetical protein
MVQEKKNTIHQTINTILLSLISIVAGLIYSSNIRINNKLDELTKDNIQNKIEISQIKENYQSKLDAEKDKSYILTLINKNN